MTAEILAERLLPLSVLAVAAIAAPVLIFSPGGYERLESLREERRDAEVEISRLRQEIHQLRASVDRMKRDPRAVERVARDQLGLVRQTELVFQFRE